MPEDKKDQPKMVPESDLIALKERVRKLTSQLSEKDTKIAELSTSTSELQKQLKAAKANLEDDDEVKEVRQYLLDEGARIAKLEAEHKTRESSMTERERKVRAKELVADYAAKGLTLKEDDLLTAEDMEKHGSDSYTKFLAEENAKLKSQPKQGTPESVFDGGPGGIVKKQPKDMTDQEFTAYYDGLRQEALSKR